MSGLALVCGVLLVVAGCRKGEDFDRVTAGRIDRFGDGGPGSDSGLDGSADGSSSGQSGDGASRDGGSGGPGSGGGTGGGDGTDGGGVYILDGSVRLPDGSEVLADGAIELPDGEVISEDTAQTRYAEDIDIATCSMSEIDSWETSVAFANEGGFALTPAAIEGFSLAYRARTTGNCTQNVNIVHVPPSGAFPTPTTVLGDCKAIRDVTLLDQRDRGYLAWIDNFSLTAELHTIELGPGLRLPGSIVRDTVTMSEPEFEMKPVITAVDGRPLLAWITRDADTDESGVMGKWLDDGSEAFAILPKGSSQAPDGLAIAPVGFEGSATVAWVGAQQMPGVWLQPLATDGRPVGTPQQLTERVGASSSVSLASRSDGGGAVYSIVIDGLPQVRYFRIDGAGNPVGAERAVVGPPMRAQDASIAPAGGGYAMAYRSLPAEGGSEAEIRLLFLTRDGSTIRDAAGRTLSAFVAPATISTGRTSIAVSVDGQIMIAWIDADPNGDENLLKVVRRQLQCGS